MVGVHSPNQVLFQYLQLQRSPLKYLSNPLLTSLSFLISKIQFDARHFRRKDKKNDATGKGRSSQTALSLLKGRSIPRHLELS